MKATLREFNFHFFQGQQGIYFLGGLALGAAIVAWSFLSIGFVFDAPASAEAVEEVILSPRPNFQPLPEPVFSQPFEARGIYLSPAVVGDPERFELFFNKLKNSDFNAVVIDLKDFEGDLTFRPENLELKKYAPDKVWVENMAGIVRRLRHIGFYTIARLPVFQDSAFAEKMPALALKKRGANRLWRDSQGNGWLDPASRAVWAYNGLLAQEAKRLGFDEVNFDYVRFPSDGALNKIEFPLWDGVKSKDDVLRSFFEYLDKTVRQDGIVISADIFGMVLLENHDLKIGQRLTDVLPFFDYVSPMMYPSHYPKNFAGYANPAAHPGQVIAAGFGNVQETLLAYPDAKIRPWLQDFDMGAKYDLSKVKAQISAAEEKNGFGWLLWNASNRYTEEIFREEWND